jgi:hypothetical protein
MKLPSLLAILILAIFGAACHQARQNYSSMDIDAHMASLSAQTVERARSGYGVTLDYSPNSIKEVEKLLAAKYELQKTHPMTEKELADAADLWGAYIGEVIKRIRPAHWARDSEIAGKGALPIVYEDNSGESYPCAWVYHRLKNGEEDNVWIKFHYFTQPGGVKKYFPPKKESDPSGKNKNAPKS